MIPSVTSGNCQLLQLSKLPLHMWKYSPLLMYLLNVINIPYGQSSAKLPVTQSLGHSVTRLLGHSINFNIATN